MDPGAIYQGLNAEQRWAVDAVRGPVCILAGAGTGKTRTVTRRIAAQVATESFAAEQLLAVTFTDKAAGEMRARLSALGITGVRARTFHSAAAAQLHHLRGEPLGQILPSKVLPLRRIANSLPKPYRFRPAADLASEIERAKNRQVAPDGYLDALDEHTPPIPPDLMSRVYARYEREKRSHNLVDFEDLIELAIRMFCEDPVALERFTARYKAFTVDEYQDVNLLQQSLLECWLDGRDELCVVGDDYQSIYGFTGATPHYLLDMPRRYPSATVVRLEDNYRSTPQVLEMANRVAQKLGGAPKALRATLPSGPNVVLEPFVSPEDESRFICDAVRRLHDTDGVAHEDMAILYRVNFRSEDYESALMQARIPFSVRDGAFLQRQAARRMMTALQKSSAVDVAERVRVLAQRDGWLADPPDDLGDQEMTRQGDLSRLVSLAEELDSTTATGRDFVATLKARFGSEGDGRGGAGSAGPQDRRGAGSAGPQDRRGAGSAGPQDRRGAGSAGPQTGVNLLTYHRAKGLEFEAVFLPRLQEGELPFRRVTDPGGLAEERRLFYVGLTRARRYLFVTWCVGGRAAPSRFVRPLTDSRRAAGGGRPPPADDDEIFDALKSWRLQRARRDGVPPYVILHDRTVREIARRSPLNTAQLASISGIGPTKLERYGKEILATVRERR